MRFFFYFRTHFDDPGNMGVITKCRSIVSAFAHCGHSTEFWHFSSLGLEKQFSGLPEMVWKNKKYHWRHWVLFYGLSDRFLLKRIDFRTIEVLFIRHFPNHPYFIYFLKRAKKQNPALKIVIEFPTWPYAGEATGFWQRVVYRVDQYYNQKLHLYADYAIHYGQENTLLGIPVIHLSNGIELASVPLAHFKPKNKPLVRLIAVGNWGFWQGLDRVLTGMAAYFHQLAPVDVHLQIIGAGTAIPLLKEMVHELNLKGKVTFSAPCQGEELNQHFNDADLAVGVLGLHRKGLQVASPLKHRTYCARGIPMILAGQDSDFAADWPYCFRCPEDDSPVDINKVIQFAQQFTVEDRAKMRLFAEENLSWISKIRAVSDRYFPTVHPAV